MGSGRADSVSQAQAVIPTTSGSTTYLNAAASIGEPPDPTVAPSTPVWVVTVDSAFAYATGPATGHQLAASYTMIVDAANGAPIDVCDGAC